MDNTNLVNLSFLENFTKGSTEKRNQYINLYLKTAPQLFSDLQILFDKQEWDELYIKAHSLKPQVLYMGIPNLSKLLIRIEEIAQQKGNKDELGPMVREAIECNDRAMIELKQILTVIE